MTTSSLTAQGRVFADPPNIVEIVPDKRWRVSLQVLEWEGGLASTNISRVVYWWPISLPFSQWPKPVFDPTLGPINGGQANNGYTKPPGTDTSTSAVPAGSGATILGAQDSPADGFFPSLVRIGLNNVNDGPNLYTWYHLSPFTSRSISVGGSTADIESQFRVQVRLGVKPAGIDGGTP